VQQSVLKAISGVHGFGFLDEILDHGDPKLAERNLPTFDFFNYSDDLLLCLQ
jgi:hypothetical protein